MLLLFISCIRAPSPLGPPRLPDAPVAAATPAACPDRVGPVGGAYLGDAACRAGADRWSHVPGADLACITDGDCEIVSAATCFHLTVAKRAAATYRAEQPCTEPAAGACAPFLFAARCEAGCCTPR